MARRRARWSAAATLAVAAVTALTATGCLDTPAAGELLDDPIVATKRDPAADFASPSTFAMPDSIPLIEDVGTGPATKTVDPAIAGASLDEIAAQLTARGYRRVARTDGPDLAVAVTAVNETRNTNIAYGGWWGSGDATTPAFWGYDGATIDTPFSYPSVAWASGTVIIELYDLRAARDEAGRTGTRPTIASTSTAATARIPVLWAAFIHGVVGPPGASLAEPPLGLIRQAFAQSEYLHR